MRSLLAKILTFLLLFNFATWLFFLLSDDFIKTTVVGKKVTLEERALLFAKIAQPVLEDQDLNEFRKGLKLRNMLDDPRLLHQRSIKIYRYDQDKEILDSLIYFDGSKHLNSEIKVNELPEIGNPEPEEKKDIGTRIFDLFGPFMVANLLTEPIVEIRSKFNLQTEITDLGNNNFKIRSLSPIKSGRKTVGIVEAEENIGLGALYAKRNAFRLNILIGLSCITVVLGLILAFSIVIPLRRLSRRLKKKLTPDDLATQLQGFRIKGLSARKDEIGSLYQSLNTLTHQVSELFGEKERFASDVAHELKNPIASIIAHTENYNATQSESANTVIAKVRQQAQRMNKLVTEISEAAIVDNDLVTKKRERVNVSEIISEIVHHYAEVNEYPSVKISADLQQNIQMEVLPERIGQITVNLIENALSFAQPKGEIKVTLKKQIFSRAILTIEDSGPGVREELRELIFERFFSKRTGASHSENSSGLGLYISKQIVEAHGGKIFVETSETLSGAKFVVSL